MDYISQSSDFTLYLDYLIEKCQTLILTSMWPINIIIISWSRSSSIIIITIITISSSIIIFLLPFIIIIININFPSNRGYMCSRAEKYQNMLINIHLGPIRKSMNILRART